MNPLFAWITTRMSMLSIVYPDFTGKFTGGKGFTGQGVNFSTAMNDGNPVDRDAINFYVAFRNYLRISRPIFSFIRWLGATGAKILYDIANALIKFFAMGFKLFDIAGDPLGEQGPYSEIHKWFHWGFLFGTSIMFLVIAVYLIMDFLNGASFSRDKNIIRNICLIIFVICGLPTMTGIMSKGAVDVVDDAFGIKVSSQSNQVASEAQRLFQNNVYSVPRRILLMKPGQSFDIGPGLGLTQEKTHGYADVSAKPLIIRLGRMSQSTRNEYNGLGTDDHPNSIMTFLNDYSHNQLLNEDKVKEITTSARDTAAKQKGAGGQAKNATTDAINDIPIIGNFLAKRDQGSVATNFTDAMSYYIDVASPTASSTRATGGYDEHKISKFSSFSDNPVKIAKIMYQSYDMYYVNWFAIYSGLLMLIMVTATYIYKLFLLLYKLVVMYVSSGFLMARNVDNYGRLKSWIRDFFSIYEMLIMMVVMFRMFFLVYDIANDVIDKAVMSSNSGFIANPWVEPCLDLIADLGLFKISEKNITSVDNMIGSEGGGGANTGMSGFVGNLLAIRGAESIGRHIGRGVGAITSPIRHPFKAANSSKGGKHDVIRHVGKGHGLSDTGNRYKNHNNQAKKRAEQARKRKTLQNHKSPQSKANHKPGSNNSSNGSNSSASPSTNSLNDNDSDRHNEAEKSQEDSEDHVSNSDSANDSDSQAPDSDSSEDVSDDADSLDDTDSEHSSDNGSVNGSDVQNSDTDIASDSNSGEDGSNGTIVNNSGNNNSNFSSHSEQNSVSRSASYNQNSARNYSSGNQNTHYSGDDYTGGYQQYNSQNNSDFNSDFNSEAGNSSDGDDDRPFLMNGDPGPSSDNPQPPYTPDDNPSAPSGNSTTNNFNYGHNHINRSHNDRHYHAPNHISFKHGGNHVNSHHTSNTHNDYHRK